MKTFSLYSKFRRWASVVFFSSGGEVLRKEASSECTWVNDPDTSKTIEIGVGERAVVCHHGEHGSRVGEFVGFTPEELSSSVEAGYYLEWGQMTRRPAYIETLKDLVTARAFGAEIVLWSHFKDGVHSLDYRWGCQNTEWLVLVKDGRLVDTSAGCGDGAPYLVVTEAECLTLGRLVTSSKIEDQMAAIHEEDEFAWSPAGADERACEDSTGILARLLRHYRRGQNPLRSLRKEKGGVWTFHRVPPLASPGTQVFWGESWWVTWEK